MKFTDLEDQEQKKLHKELLSYAESIGGKNFFLGMLEDIKANGSNPLLDKSSSFKFSHGYISWNKSIYKDTYKVLFEAMRREERDGDMLKNVPPKEYKMNMNMMRTMKPINIDIKPKNIKDGDGFSLSILDTTKSRETEVSLIFKIIFFYNIGFAKSVLNYKESEED